MRVKIEGYDLPGRTFCGPSGEPYSNVHVGVQICKSAEQLVPGNADGDRWETDAAVATSPDGSLDFKGPAVHGRRGDRFLYLTWATSTPQGTSTCSVGPNSC